MDTLGRTFYVFSTNIGMEIEIKKMWNFYLGENKSSRCEGIKLSNSEVMKEVGRGYTYLGRVELDKIKVNEMKEKTVKEYKQRLR